MSKSRKWTILFFIIAAVSWFVEIVFTPSHVEVVLGIAAVASTILFACFLVTAIVKRRKPDVSKYKIFACTDAVIGVGVAAYAIYDIAAATGWFGGLVGTLLLIFVIPVVLFLLIVDFIFYKRNKKK